MSLERRLNIFLICILLIMLLQQQQQQHQVSAYAIGQSKYGNIEKFPYQVLMIGKQLWRRRMLCGGTLIENRWILTAAHCTIGVTHFDIYLGAKSVDDRAESGRLILRSNKFIAHENFDAETAANDIALVKLPEDVKFTERIQPATLPYRQKYEQFTGHAVVATGWGAVGETSNSDVMQYTELRVITSTECKEEYDVITKGILCAKGLKDETVCSGDSGGPLVLKNTPVVVGITSFGPADGCETNIPGGFTRVTYYLDWIDSKIGTNNKQQSQQQQQHPQYAHTQHSQTQKQQQQQRISHPNNLLTEHENILL